MQPEVPQHRSNMADSLRATCTSRAEPSGRTYTNETEPMTESPRPWWRNCALTPDPEILAIDRMEDQIAPIAADVSNIRQLISSLELCHHKAERWVDNIIAAIGTGETTKGLGTRSPGQRHPAETVWQNACAALSAWIAGCPATSVDLTIGTVPASQMLACLGDRSPLKEWQVQRVTEKIRSTIHWPQPQDGPTVEYAWLLLGGDEYDCAYRIRCPGRFKEHERFWLATVKTMIHDTENGAEADISLGVVIDMLWPCHWRFVDNLKVVLGAIGGNLYPEEPLAACGRNIGLLPIRGRMEAVCSTLNTFCGAPEPAKGADSHLLELLGTRTPQKRWLAASLDKTIRLQLDPPTDVRATSALAGPDWIRE